MEWSFLYFDFSKFLVHMYFLKFSRFHRNFFVSRVSIVKFLEFLFKLDLSLNLTTRPSFPFLINDTFSLSESQWLVSLHENSYHSFLSDLITLINAFGLTHNLKMIPI